MDVIKCFEPPTPTSDAAGPEPSSIVPAVAPLMIRLETRNFQGNYAGANHAMRDEPISRVDLIRGILTAGKASWADAARGGVARWFEIGSLTLQVLAYVKSDKGNLCTTDLYGNLDGSEKALFSYRAGQAIAKLVAESHLQVPWMQHVDSLVNSGAARTATGTRQRADLAGRDWNGDWHVIEAKGRSNRPEAGLMAQAKAQAAAVVSINLTAPRTRSGAVADIGARPFEATVEDPDESPLAPIEFLINEEEFYRDCYDILDALRAGRAEFREIVLTSGGYTVAGIPGTRVSIGVRRELFERIGIRPESFERVLADLQPELREGVSAVRDPGVSIGLDGLVVISSEEGDGQHDHERRVAPAIARGQSQTAQSGGQQKAVVKQYWRTKAEEPEVERVYVRNG